MAEDTLTITDNRTGHEYTLPITDGTIRATDLQQIRAEDDERRSDGLRPGIPQHRVLPQRDHVHRRRRGDPALPRVSDRAARGGGDVPRDRVPPARRRAPERRAAPPVGGGRPLPHVRPHERPEVPRGLPVRRAPDGDAARRGRCPLDLLSGREGHRRSGRALPPARPADGEAPDHRGLRLPARARPAVRPAAQRPRLHRQLRQHDVRDRREARAQRRPAAGARDPASSSMPTTSRTARRAPSAGSGRRTSTRSLRSRRGSRRSTGRSTAAPTRRCSGCSTRSARRRTCRASSSR